MKLSPDSTFLLVVMLACVELFDFITARPASIPQGKTDLQMLHQNMRRLMKMVNRGNKQYEYKHSLTSLPSMNYSPEDLKSLELSSTLAHLSSGLKSFKFHLDWLQQNKEEVEDESSETKRLAEFIQHLIRQIGTTPEPVHPSLPPLKTFWNLHQANVEIHDKLYYFCNWYIRALAVLNHKRSRRTSSS